MHKEKEDIVIKVTNDTDYDIEDVQILSGKDKDGITIQSQTKGYNYDELLGLLLGAKFDILISTHYLSGDNKVIFLPFRVHTVNVNGKYVGVEVFPFESEETVASGNKTWLATTTVKWGGKKKLTYIVYPTIPANTSFMMVLSIIPEKEPIEAPEGAIKVLYSHELKEPSYKIVLHNLSAVILQLTADKPKEIFSLNYSNEDAFFTCSNYTNSGVDVLCAAWKDKKVQTMDWEDFYRLLKTEGLKSLVY